MRLAGASDEQHQLNFIRIGLGAIDDVLQFDELSLVLAVCVDHVTFMKCCRPKKNVSNSTERDNNEKICRRYLPQNFPLPQLSSTFFETILWLSTTPTITVNSNNNGFLNIIISIDESETKFIRLSRRTHRNLNVRRTRRSTRMEL